MTIPMDGETMISASESREDFMGDRVTEPGIHVVVLWAEKSLSTSVKPGSKPSRFLIKLLCFIKVDETMIQLFVGEPCIVGAGKGAIFSNGDFRMGK